MHTEGFEFHLNMDEIKVKFETGDSKRGNLPLTRSVFG